MSHLGRLPRTLEIRMRPDAEGYVGRKCPQRGCKGYFKITPGTGLKDTTACYCPYCGHAGDHSAFATKDQIGYVKSVGLNKVTEAFLKDLKTWELERPARGGFGISVKVSGQPHPIRYYREKRLETALVCEKCTLRYAVYGEFAFCPDCGSHNSLQILRKNLELVEKVLAVAAGIEDEALRRQLVCDALENIVSSFDGFGREACRVNAGRARQAEKAKAISFQNLTSARKELLELFGFDLSAGLQAGEWEAACRAFQKRHLIAHKMGVVDEKYRAATKDPAAVIGRKVQVTPEEVRSAAALAGKLGSHLWQQLSGEANPA